MIDDPPVTLPEAVRLLAASSRGQLTVHDFTPLPCSHPSCFALTYLLRTEGGLVSLPRILDASSYLEIIKNQSQRSKGWMEDRRNSKLSR